MAEGKRHKQAALERRDGLLCWLCEEYMPDDDRHITLVIPRSRGGTREFANCRLAHGRCNNERPLNFVASAHAAQRFREQLRPDLNETAAGDELLGLLYAGRQIDQPSSLNNARADLWMLIAPGVFVPIGVRDGCLVAITVMRKTLRTRTRLVRLSSQPRSLDA